MLVHRSKFNTTKKITVYGLVQGVGFRPYVQRCADRFRLKGNVKNIGGIVEIYTNADNKILDKFVRYLISNLPAGGAQIYDIKTEEVPYTDFDDFSIVQSDDCDVIPVIPADIGVCKKCMAEFYDKSDRRYLHPFISCTTCGPRYSIINQIPYDRINTTMSMFNMCDECNKEYTDSGNRRCYAQTIACNECGPVLYYTSGGDPLTNAVKDIMNGKVIAVKDIGGFHFVCLATDKNAVQKLRELKLRDEKPFAVMFSDTDSVSEYASLSDMDVIALQSDARPIVLVKKNNIKTLPENVCSASNDIGAFLPCNSVQAYLTKECGPLIMTSGNISGEPIITDNDKMLDLCSNSPFLDGVLYHRREIVTPLDDSIVRIIDGKMQIIRRGRGYVPLPIWLKTSNDKKIFAAGGDLKSSFCLMAENRVYMSQYFGDLENTECMRIYKKNVKKMQKMFNIFSQFFACDTHPNYFSTAFTKTLTDSPVYVQHHHAHIASVIAENGIESTVLGFAFDGTGYGTDGTVWGGEVMICKGEDFTRVSHLKPVKMCGGDEISKNAKTAAQCYLLDAGIKPGYEDSAIIESALNANVGTIYSSSMGRLFDAVSSLLKISDYNDFEGKCAILLEISASKAKKPYPLKIPVNGEIWDTAEFIRQIVNAKAPKDEIALGFHHAIADAVLETAERYNISNIALSGGVFMNRILTELCIDKLRKKGYNVYINHQVPTNDGGIALGQAYILSEKVK